MSLNMVANRADKGTFQVARLQVEREMGIVLRLVKRGSTSVRVKPESSPRPPDGVEHDPSSPRKPDNVDR